MTIRRRAEVVCQGRSYEFEMGKVPKGYVWVGLLSSPPVSEVVER